MTLSVTFNDINNLDDVAFVAGTTFILNYNVFDQNGAPIDLSTAICKWHCAPYGTDFTQIQKTASVIATNTFQVILSPADTNGLSGKFTQQPSIEFSNGTFIIPSQGIITLLKGLQ